MGVVKLPDDDPGTVGRVITFLYLGDYSEDSHTIAMHTGREDFNTGFNNANV